MVIMTTSSPYESAYRAGEHRTRFRAGVSEDPQNFVCEGVVSPPARSWRGCEAAGRAARPEEDDMTQYLISVHHAVDEALPPEEEWQPRFEAVDRFNQKLQAEGAWVFAGGLMPIEQATTVDNTGDKPIVTDGPYAESKEYLGGFWVIEAPDLDAALRWAEEGSKACAGKVEVRPFQGE
jgi:hypothetical protein